MKSQILRNHSYNKTRFTSTIFKNDPTKIKDNEYATLCYGGRCPEKLSYCSCVLFGNHPPSPYPRKMINEQHYENQEMITFEINDVNYSNCAMDNSTFNKIKINNVNFVKHFFFDGEFSLCEIEKSCFAFNVFQNTNIKNTNFRDCYFENVTFFGVTFDDSNFRGCVFNSCVFLECNVEISTRTYEFIPEWAVEELKKSDGGERITRIKYFDKNCSLSNTLFINLKSVNDNEEIVYASYVNDEVLVDHSYIYTFYENNKE